MTITTTPNTTKTCSCGEAGRYTGRFEGLLAIFRCPKGHEWPVKP